MAEKKKKKSRFKKIFKNLAKVAALGGAAYGASKMFGGKRGPVSTVGQPFGVSRAAYKPAHLGEGVAGHYKDDIMTGGTGMTPDKTDRPWYKFWKEGGRVNAKKGGRIGVGIAKRGYGRALGRGKK